MTSLPPTTTTTTSAMTTLDCAEAVEPTPPQSGRAGGENRKVRRCKRVYGRNRGRSQHNGPITEIINVNASIGATNERLTSCDSDLLEPKNVCDQFLFKDCNLAFRLAFTVTRKLFVCLYSLMCGKSSISLVLTLAFAVVLSAGRVSAWANELDKTEQFLDKINLEEKSIAAVFNKVAYGSTTKRSIPDNSYPVTTMATMLLTTFRYSDGSEEWARVDIKNRNSNQPEPERSNVDFEQPEFEPENSRRDLDGYGTDLEKDHVLPTSAPAADILKNNNNRQYGNPNRYNNDRIRPDVNSPHEQVTENIYKTTTTYNLLRNVKPTKSIYSKASPSYIPPSRAFFTPPLPPALQNPYADKPTLRGTNSDSFVNRRPIPPPSLMPTKDRIPFRPDLPKVNVEKAPSRPEVQPRPSKDEKTEKKKSLNTPSQSGRLGDFYGSKNDSISSFEYEKNNVPSITRILSGSNGRHDDIPDILLRTVTANPNVDRIEKVAKTRAPSAEPSLKRQEEPKFEAPAEEYPSPEEPPGGTKKEVLSESVTVKKDVSGAPVPDQKKTVYVEDVTTQMSDSVNLPNVKEKDANVTAVGSDQIWLICWNVHVYLVVVGYILLAAFSIFKLIRYENDPHMFSKSYFLTIHLMLTVICVLRIFYLIYDPYNEHKSFNIFLYDFLHTFPLSLLATTFAVLILFLLKRTLTHLEVKTRPVILVVFALLHILLCFCLSIFESLGIGLERASVCKPVFVLLAWALGFSYLYLYRIIKNVLAKKSQNLSEMCTQNISYASHITIAVALLFILLGLVQLYALFFIKVDKFTVPHHWILWGFELSVRFIEISIITLLAIVVSLRMSQREKQASGGFPLFPCTTSDSSTDNIYPNNCTTNPNALNYSRQEMILDNIPAEPIERPNLLKNAFQNDSFDKKSTLERYQSDSERNSNFDRFERPKWGSDRFDSRQNMDQSSLSSNFGQPSSGNFDRTGHNSLHNSIRNDIRNSGRKHYEPAAKYYTGNNEEYQNDILANSERNIYSEPLDNPQGHQYERTRHEFERNDFERRSRNSTNTSGRRSTGRSRKNHPRPHLGIQTLPNHDRNQTMLVDEQGFVRFKALRGDQNHFSDA
ncbi:uncharacterized protein LOC126750389 [Anthonomus grandis grandis]|uniref:uncharacterized protein LOC126750389 n=1 Tax=Anthonomus grandis grandis TaxID=2921223 RepID=UPI002166A2D9|nr:uncharacterized protein LOC126750389 [Anthonomus grandis grandis]XP_050315964.1 uncharacterized protein LOC126750389 [Anthonomus grandis grandis]XP_050315965.1 uncharacterized protein LOC126750389 [Anthonomus grandis grandis]